MQKYPQKNTKETYTNNWATPKHIYDYFMNLGFFDPNPLNSIIDPKTFDRNDNLFINPPYERGVIDLFIDMAIRNHKKYGRYVILLIPSRTDTGYFQKLLDYGCNIQFIKGRLKFGGVGSPAPFPSCLIMLNGEANKRFQGIITKEIMKGV